MMQRHVIAFTLALLATVPAVVYATVPCPSLERGGFPAGLLLIGLAGVLSTLIGCYAEGRVRRLQSELEAERERKARFEAHSRDMYRELERKLEERTAELRRERDIAVRTEKLISLGRLVGGVAHELNNPLMAILGEAMILRERHSTPELSRGLRVIEQQARRCADLIRDLAAFAGLEQRKVQPLDVHALLEGALAQAATVASGREVKVVRHYWQEPLVVNGNLEQLQQALANVIDNAYRAMADSPSPQLTVRSRHEAGWVRLEISDTGSGIEPDVLPYIFDPFYSQPQGGMRLSAGLGLSVALGLVRAHGGRIEASSEPGIW
ncbi:MAG: hypothetical protein K6V36_04285 [Anaerolineae bacterium]|nr:hypothetical protein [Anaerolineae bacterium]